MYERCRRLLADELGAYPSPETESIYRGLLEAPPAPDCRDADSRGAATRRGARRRCERGSKGRVARRWLRRKRVVVAHRPSWWRGGRSPASSHARRRASATIGRAELDRRAGPVRFDRGDRLRSAHGRSPSRRARARCGWRTSTTRASRSVDDPSRQARADTFPLGDTPTATRRRGTAACWVDRPRPATISKIDPRYDRVYPLRRRFGPLRRSSVAQRCWPALAAFGSIWIVSPDGVRPASRPRASSAGRMESVAVGNVPSAIAAGAGSVWVTNSDDGTVTRIDPETLWRRPIPVGNGPAAVAVERRRRAWIANAGDNALVQCRPGDERRREHDDGSVTGRRRS